MLENKNSKASNKVITTVLLHPRIITLLSVRLPKQIIKVNFKIKKIMLLI